MSQSNSSALGSPPDRRLLIDDTEAWLLSKLLANIQVELKSAPVSDWLAHFLSFVDLRKQAGRDLLFGLLHPDSLERLRRQDPRSSEPTITIDSYVVANQRLLHASQIDSMPPVRFLVPNEIPAQSLVLLFGASGVGKSFVALDYALHIAQGSPVVYVAAEGRSGYPARKKAWITKNGMSDGSLYFYFDAVRMLEPSEVDAFIEVSRLVSPALVIIDTLARCIIGGDENTPRDMTRFIDGCERVKTALGATVLVVHHTGKSGASERGHSSLRAACDMMIELTSDDEVIALACSKSKDTESFPTRYLRLLPMQLTPEVSSCVLVPSERAMKAKGQSLSRNQREIVEALSMTQFLEAGASVRQLREITGIPERSIHRTMDHLMRWQYVRQAKRGEPYSLTEEGQRIIGD